MAILSFSSVLTAWVTGIFISAVVQIPNALRFAWNESESDMVEYNKCKIMGAFASFSDRKRCILIEEQYLRTFTERMYDKWIKSVSWCGPLGCEPINSAFSNWWGPALFVIFLLPSFVRLAELIYVKKEFRRVNKKI